jgi:hypothetical protein
MLHLAKKRYDFIRQIWRQHGHALQEKWQFQMLERFFGRKREQVANSIQMAKPSISISSDSYSPFYKKLLYYHLQSNEFAY